MSENQPNCGETEASRDAVEDSAPGLNDNIEFMGKQLHVQTERIGFPAPHIATQVFSNGRIVFSRKSEISPAYGPGSQGIRDRMRAQHFQTIREIGAKQKKILDGCPGPVPE